MLNNGYVILNEVSREDEKHTEEKNLLTENMYHGEGIANVKKHREEVYRGNTRKKRSCKIRDVQIEK